MNKTESVAARLKYIMNQRGLKQVDVLNLARPYCEKYNVKLAKNYLSQYCSGKNEPGKDILNVLSLALDVNPAWLQGFGCSTGVFRCRKQHKRGYFKKSLQSVPEMITPAKKQIPLRHLRQILKIITQRIFVKTIKHQIIIQITTHEIILTVITRQTILRKDMQK